MLWPLRVMRGEGAGKGLSLMGREAEGRFEEQLEERLLAAGKQSQWPCWW